MNFDMEQIKQRFGDDFIQAVKDFCENVTIASEDFAKAVVKIGDAIDEFFNYESGFAAKSIIAILHKNDNFRKTTQEAVTLLGLDCLGALFRNLFPCSKIGNNVYILVNFRHDEYIPDLIEPKPYEGYCDPKHRLPCKPIAGHRRMNQWKRTRSNPKLR